MTKKLTALLSLCAGSLFAQDYVAPCDLDWSPNKDTLYITAQSGQKIIARTGDSSSEIPLNVSLTGLTVSKDGKTLYVTGDGYYGKLFVIDAASKKVKETIKVGHTPMAPTLSPDEKTIYVCNRFNNNVQIIDLKSKKTLGKVDVLREPVSATLTHDGKTLFVANHNPDGAADLEYVASKISAINVADQTVETIKLVNGSEGVREIRTSPDGKYVYATHLMARFLVPTTQLERGWVSTDALSVIDSASRKLIYTVLLDDVDMGFPNPWAIAFSDDSTQLLVSSAGAHEISIIDLPELVKKIEDERKASSTADAHLDAHNNLSFLSGIRKRISLAGNGPRAIAVKGNKAIVANYFSDTLEILDITTGKVEDLIELNPDFELTQVRQGEVFFNDANLCFQKWLSCVTCHPDGRTDALNWDLLNDGMGNPKNVKSMLYSHRTPRAMITGIRADAETGVRAGIRHIQFAVRPEKDAVAIDEYLKSLTPEMSPYLVDGKMSKSGKRGEKIFEEIGCASCHPAPLYTDMELYEVGTTVGQDIGKPLDVPTLVEVWRTAPYLNDGRAKDMHELLTKFDHAGTLSETEKLSEKQLKDLEIFLLSL